MTADQGTRKAAAHEVLASAALSPLLAGTLFVPILYVTMELRPDWIPPQTASSAWHSAVAVRIMLLPPIWLTSILWAYLMVVLVGLPAWYLVRWLGRGGSATLALLGGLGGGVLTWATYYPEATTDLTQRYSIAALEGAALGALVAVCLGQSVRRRCHRAT